MRLTKDNLAHYLIDKGFLHPEKLVSGQYRVIGLTHRNSIFQVESADRGLFVKQLNLFDTHNSYSMQREATALYVIHKTDVLIQVSPYVPAYHGYDIQSQVLVTELFPQALSLNEFFKAKQAIPVDVARKIAKILKSVHINLEEKYADSRSLQFFPKNVPWILNLGDTQTNQFSETTKNNPVMQWIANQPAICDAMERLRFEWSGSFFIHGDIKLINFISPVMEEAELRLVDWEISDLGDPLWDVAGLIQSVIEFGFTALDPNNNAPIAGMEFVSDGQMREFLRSFWASYIENNVEIDGTDPQTRIRLMKYTAARMFQTAYECNVYNSTLTQHVQKLLEYCQLLFQSPELMANTLLGESDAISTAA